MQILPVQAPLDQAPADDVRAASAIAHVLDGFPLALDQAGAYLEKWGGDLTTYLTLYQKQRAYLLSKRGQAAEDHHESVTSTFAFAFAQLKDTIPCSYVHQCFPSLILSEHILYQTPTNIDIFHFISIGSALNHFQTDEQPLTKRSVP